MMDRVWQELEEFPNYGVSNHGEFSNLRTGGEVRPSRTQQGHAKVSLYLDGRLLTRSAALLVAHAFLEQPFEYWDTPIHLDGDLMNCAAWNLMWRPRWFAIKYHKQFYNENFHNDTVRRVELETGETYETGKEACIANGLYYFDIVKSCIEETFVPLTHQEFRVA